MVTAVGNLMWIALVLFVGLWFVLALILIVLVIARKISLGVAAGIIFGTGFMAAVPVFVAVSLLQGRDSVIIIKVGEWIESILSGDLGGGLLPPKEDSMLPLFILMTIGRLVDRVRLVFRSVFPRKLALARRFLSR